MRPSFLVGTCRARAHCAVCTTGRHRDRQLHAELALDLASFPSMRMMCCRDRVGFGASRLDRFDRRWGGPMVVGRVEAGPLVARGKRLHDSLDALPGRGAADERVHGDALLELKGRAVATAVDVHGHGFLRSLAPGIVAPRAPRGFELVVKVVQLGWVCWGPRVCLAVGVGDHRWVRSCRRLIASNAAAARATARGSGPAGANRATNRGSGADRSSPSRTRSGSHPVSSTSRSNGTPASAACLSANETR
jgi:hypothetical protein